MLKEIYSFYSNLYNVKPDIQTDLTDCPFFATPTVIRKLNVAMKEMCNGQLTYSKCFKVLSTFENNKTPVNDSLSIKFDKFFWPEVGTLLVDSLNYAYVYRELSNSQKRSSN